MAMLAHIRPGETVKFCVQAGLSARPLAVLQTSPSLYPTQILSELPGATAMALMSVPMGCLITVQSGQFGSHVWTLKVRQRLVPPATIAFALLGSRTKGAMKLALVESFESGIPQRPHIAPAQQFRSRPRYASSP